MPLELPDRATDCCTHHSHSHFLHQIVPHNPDTLPLAVLQFLGYPPRSCPTLQIMSPAITCLPFAHQVLCSSKASLYQASWLLAPAINGLVSSVSRTQRRLGWGQSLGDALSDLPGVTLWFGTRQGGPGSVCVCGGGGVDSGSQGCREEDRARAWGSHLPPLCSSTARRRKAPVSLLGPLCEAITDQQCGLSSLT